MIDTLKVFDVDGSAAIACRIFLFYGVCLLKESAPGRYAEVTGVIAISPQSVSDMPQRHNRATFRSIKSRIRAHEKARAITKIGRASCRERV